MIRLKRRPIQQLSTTLVEAIESNPALGDVIWRGRKSVVPSVKPPQLVDGSLFQWPKNQKVVGLWDRSLTRLNRPTVFYPHGYIKLLSGLFAIDTHWTSSQSPVNELSDSLRNRLFRKRPGDWFSLLIYWGEGYYHWFCDVLPKLHHTLSQLPPSTRFLVPPSPPSWMIDSLTALGINGECIVPFRGTLPWRVNSLFYASPVGMTGDIDAEAVQWIRDRVASPSAVSHDIKPWRRILISRADAGCRRISNETALVEAMRPFQFEPHSLAGLSFKDQVALFSEASIIMAPHGAGLTNILWSSPGATVIEFFEPSVVRRCYWSLARGLGHEYYASIESTVPNRNAESDILVDIQRIVTFLRQQVAPRSGPD